MSEEKVISIENVSFQFDQRVVLENVSLTVSKGEFLGLIGPNGSGKSTLLKIILGILQPYSGKVSLFGEQVKYFRDWDKIGFVSQKANSFNTGFPATVFEVVSMGLFGKIGLFRFLNRSHKQKVFDVIEHVGMKEYANHNIGELSGGQQQRVFIARALVSEPALLILDEPTVGVDAKNIHQFYDMIESLHKRRNMTILMVTHDIGAMTEHVTSVACLNKRLHFHGGTDEFLKSHELSSFHGDDAHLLTHHHSHGG